MRISVEYLLFTATRGAASRWRLQLYRLLGMKMGKYNRIESGGRVRRGHAKRSAGHGCRGRACTSLAQFRTGPSHRRLVVKEILANFEQETPIRKTTMRTSRPIRALLAHPGTQHSYSLARQLH